MIDGGKGGSASIGVRYARLAALRRGGGAASSVSASAALRLPKVAAFAVCVFAREARVLAGVAMTRGAARPLVCFGSAAESVEVALPLPFGSMGMTSTAVVTEPGLMSRESAVGCVGRLMMRGDAMVGAAGGVASVGVLSEETVRESSGVEAL